MAVYACARGLGKLPTLLIYTNIPVDILNAVGCAIKGTGARAASFSGAVAGGKSPLRPSGFRRAIHNAAQNCFEGILKHHNASFFFFNVLFYLCN